MCPAPTSPIAPVLATPACQALAAPIVGPGATCLCHRLRVASPALAASVVRAVPATRRDTRSPRAFLLVTPGDVPALLAALQALGVAWLGAEAGAGEATSGGACRALVEAAQCAATGEALLWTLAAGWGARFDEATRAAWTAAYLACAGAVERAGAAVERALAAQTCGRVAACVAHRAAHGVTAAALRPAA